jgi:hypothetical protein
MRLGQTPASALAAYNGYTWPTTPGSAGQQMTTDGAGNLTWGDSDGIPWTAKGQLIVGTGAGTDTLLNVGGNTSFLIADSSTASGLIYSGSSTSAAQMPAGDGTQRPSPAAAGQIRFNTVTQKFEFYTGSGWDEVASGPSPTPPIPSTIVSSVSGTAPIVSSGGNTPAISITPATSGAAGSMSAADKAKLDGASTIVSSVDVAGGTTGLTFSGGPITSSGTITMAGTLAITNGGTGAATVPGAQANLLPAQAGNAGKVLATDGAGVLSWAPAGGGGTVTGVTGTAPIVSSGGAAPDLSITPATSGAAGSMSAADKAKLDAAATLVSSVDVAGGTTGLTFSGGPITSSGTITMAGTLGIANGGTGGTTQAAAQANLLPSQATHAGEFLTTDGAGVLSWASSGGATPSVPAGSVMLFYQAAAPVGWTQVTTQNDKALRVVSGAGGGSGGTTPFSTFFSTTSSYTGSMTITSGQVSDTTLSTAQLAAHSHPLCPSIDGNVFGGAVNVKNLFAGALSIDTSYLGNTGSNSPHSHSLVGSIASGSFTSDFNVDYLDVIICTKS